MAILISQWISKDFEDGCMGIDSWYIVCARCKTQFW